MPRDLGLADRIRAKGVRVVEVAGWRERGSSTYQARAVLWHHTAGPASGATPSLNTCIYGRPDVPGPLCQVLQSRAPDGNDIAYVISSGKANHGGRGSWRGVSGNSNTAGVEVEHVGTTTADVRRHEITARILAALLEGPGASRDGDMACRHAEYATPAGRKIDFALTAPWTAGTMRSRVTYWIGRTGSGGSPPTNPGDDELSAAEVAEIKKHVDEQLKRVVHFLTSGRPDTSLFTGPGDVTWMDDPETVTLNEVMDKANMAAFFAKLAFDLANPNGFGHVMPKTGQLVPQGTDGSVPASDFWRWARESVVADREDGDRHSALMDALDGLAAAHQPADPQA